MEKKKAKNLESFIPQGGEDTVLVQARLPTSLYKKAAKKKKGKKLSWNKLFVGLTSYWVETAE